MVILLRSDYISVQEEDDDDGYPRVADLNSIRITTAARGNGRLVK